MCGTLLVEGKVGVEVKMNRDDHWEVREYLLVPTQLKKGHLKLWITSTFVARCYVFPTFQRRKPTSPIPLSSQFPTKLYCVGMTIRKFVTQSTSQVNISNPKHVNNCPWFLGYYHMGCLLDLIYLTWVLNYVWSVYCIFEKLCFCYRCWDVNTCTSLSIHCFYLSHSLLHCLTF